MTSKPSVFANAVLAVVSSIPSGQVLSYGEVAAEAGHPGAGRGVGSVLASASGVPWWRVISSTGRLTTPDPQRHAALLRSEGWAVDPLTFRIT